MKKLIIGLTLLTSMSSFADDVTSQYSCTMKVDKQVIGGVKHFQKTIELRENTSPYADNDA